SASLTSLRTHLQSSLPYFALTLRRPTLSTPFPYTTLFRSGSSGAQIDFGAVTLGSDVEIVTGAGASINFGVVSSGGNALSLDARSEEHTSELQSRENLVRPLLLEKKKEPRLWVLR